ncbi:hypothetical protein RRF57_010625 [Xylaria bambusicola]|uniref:Uncharacterized protein n=1 Tax=Xylaria bambusicola TaxID=326684 RepID=A0AAN7ZD40_9PEZI
MRVNVSDFSIPNAASSRDPFVDPHVMHTTYDFSWPEGAYLISISNSYTEDNTDSTDCTPMWAPGACRAIPPPRRGPGLRFYCGKLRGARRAPLIYTNPFNNKNLGGNKRAFLYSTEGSDSTSGEHFWVATSVAYNGTNTPVYYSAANKLQVMMLAPIISNITYPQFLCTRVSTPPFSGKIPKNDGGRKGELVNKKGHAKGRELGPGKIQSFPTWPFLGWVLFKPCFKSWGIPKVCGQLSRSIRFIYLVIQGKKSKT